MQIVPLFGQGMAGKSYPVTRQRRVNCYLDVRMDGDKTQLACYGTPGLVPFITLPAAARGILGTQTALYAASVNNWYSLASTGAILYTGSLLTNTGFVSMAYNPTQVLVVDGTGGYIYTNGVLSQITDPNFIQSATTCTFVSGYFVVNQPGSQKFWISNIFDGTTWNALAFASASAYSDNLLAVDALSGNLILFSERHHEYWQDVGSFPEVFAPIVSAASEYGIDSIASRAHINNSIIFCAHNPQGISQIVQIVGTTPQVISTPDLDYLINTFPMTSDATALSYVIDGHPMYQITFPSAGSAGRSFLYDCLTGLWQETQTGLTPYYSQRHTGNMSTRFIGDTVISDYANGNLYKLSSGAYTDNGQTILREVCSLHASSNFNVFSIDEVYLDMDTGVGLASGQGSNPQVSIECSKDNGRTFGQPILAPLGAMGQYQDRVIWRRFGSARDFVFRIRMTDPVKFAIVNSAVSVRQRPQN